MKGQHSKILVSLETIGLVPPPLGLGFSLRCYKHVAPLALWPATLQEGKLG